MKVAGELKFTRVFLNLTLAMSCGVIVRWGPATLGGADPDLGKV